MLRVYVAGPYSADPEGGTARAIDAGEDLRRAGLAPFVPHLFHYWDKRHPLPYEEVLALDLEWLRACQGLLRLPGDSAGADREVAEAMRLGLPVFHDVPSLLAWAREARRIEVLPDEPCPDQVAADALTRATN